MSFDINKDFPCQEKQNVCAFRENHISSLSTLLKIVAIAAGSFLILGTLACTTSIIALGIILVFAGGTGSLVSQSKKIVEMISTVITTSNKLESKPHPQLTRSKYARPHYVDIIK